MRTRSRCILALLLSVLTMGAVGKSSTDLQAKDDLVNSLWVGKLDQHRDGQNAVLDAILWIQSRTDDKCAGVLCFPSVEDGKDPFTSALFKVEIQLRAKGAITMAELDVLFGKGWTRGISEGAIKKNTFTTRYKSGESVVDMNLVRVEHD